MQNRRAQDILQALVQGIDPDTGDLLPMDSVVQKPEVLRALLTGMTALNAIEARAARRAQLPKNVGRPWTEIEVATVRREFESGQALEEIARAHGRSARAITHRLARLGLLSPDDPALAFLEAGRQEPTRSGRKKAD